MGPLPPPPPRPLFHPRQLLHPTLRPRLERTTYTTRRSSPLDNDESSPPPRPPAGGVRDTKQRVDKLIIIATTKEDTPKTPPAPGGPYRTTSPSQQILKLVLPRLLPTESVATSSSSQISGVVSARKVLLAPPERDHVPARRTREQNRMYGEWLFESSSCVQRCLTRAVVLGEQGDLTRAVDEMCFITHWVVSYMHQLGIPRTPRP